MIRTVEEWQQLLTGATPDEAAKKILEDVLRHYQERTREEDITQLSNALVAFAKSMPSDEKWLVHEERGRERAEAEGRAR
jgi:hypothetical protein